ncbi:glycoside hydrolase [Sorangium sp. So ce375]|uniref:glycoside hydrolase family 30 protein n=1 Tax=Sorangium sp. So ce375 TaxID=3133306 RepID=UPI003F5AECD6
MSEERDTDASKLSVTGCFRNGKGAFTMGAFRTSPIVAIAVVLLSGCSGDSAAPSDEATSTGASSGALSTGAGGGAGSGGAGSGGALSGSGGVGTASAGGTTASSSGGGMDGSGGSPSEPRPTVTAAPGTELVTIDTSVLHQRFEGWGTSLCWWADQVGGWAEAKRNAVVEAVVDPVKGLGYNVFRYNIGGGENPSHEHMKEHREMPGFQSADGTFTWENDANQRAVLLRIAERGKDLIFEAFSNSPPYWMTNSRCASGSDGGGDNLKADSYDDFAHYLTEVVRHYRDEHGITFRTLEPLNEPYANWWKSNGSQEGCHFDRASQEKIIREVAGQLTKKGLTGTVVSASDENSMDDAVRNIGAFGSETNAAFQQLNVHSYAGSKRKELRQLATELGKRLWQSESGPLGQSISDDTDAALFMAERIIKDLRELEPEAWVDWQSGDPSRSWASFTLNDSQQSYTPIKRFYMHAGFSRYIRPGATFVDVNSQDMVAAVGADGSALTIVVRNGDRTASRGYTFDLTRLPTVGPAAEAHRTSRTEDLAQLPDTAIEDYRLVVTVPAMSITTLVIPMP